MKTYIGPNSYHNSLVIPHRIHGLHGVHGIQGLLASRCAKGKGTFTIFWVPGAICQARSSCYSGSPEAGQSGLCTAVSFVTSISSRYHTKHSHIWAYYMDFGRLAGAILI